jgi:uncharacterized protein (TIGR02186 family)
MRALIAFMFLVIGAPLHAAEIDIAFTDDRVEVDTGFSGARLTLFGAVTGVDNPAESVDIVSVIRGPAARFEIRKMEKSNLIWTPGKARVINSAPALYHTYATRNINDIAPLPLQSDFRLDADFLNIAVSDSATAAAPENAKTAELYRNAFLTEAHETGLYRARTTGIEFKKGALFTITVDLPANTPVGEYGVSVFLFRDGVLLDADQTTLAVNKVGAERRIYEFAHNRPVSYGLVCVAIALLAGWLAALAFRK